MIKALPPALKKNPEMIALRAAVTELNATCKRMRAALEEPMVRGEYFQRKELLKLSQQPVIAPMLAGLLWVMNEREGDWWRGYTLQTVDGPHPTGEQALRLAHPHDLFVSGHWTQFQQQIMTDGLPQPFK